MTTRTRLHIARSIVTMMIAAIAGCDTGPPDLFGPEGGSPYDGTLPLEQRQTITDYDQIINPAFDQFQTELIKIGAGEFTVPEPRESYPCSAGGMLRRSPVMKGKAVDPLAAAAIGNRLLIPIGLTRTYADLSRASRGDSSWSWSDPLNGGEVYVSIGDGDWMVISHTSGCRLPGGQPTSPSPTTSARR